MKHAYLIAAHHQFEILIKLLKTLDSEHNDFFIHIDRKSRNIPVEEIKSACKISEVTIVPAVPVYWGGYSQIKCTLRLLSAAVQGNYDYYHYISGVDFPVKTAEYIYNWFENRERKYQYIHIGSPVIDDYYLDRLKYHRFFQDTGSKTLKAVDRVLVRIERRLKIDRTAGQNVEFQFGANWFSITHDCACYVLGREKWIRKVFSNTVCGDELLIQTIIQNSEFKNQLPPGAYNGDYRTCLRYVDWKRGRPYVFRSSDYDDLIGSEFLFARKFDLEVDAGIIEKLYAYCNTGKDLRNAGIQFSN